MLRILLALCALLALSVVFFTTSPTGQILSIMGENRCFLEMYTKLPEEARVTIIGSSRERRAIQPDVITDRLNLPERAVVNLGHPSPSMPLDLAIMRRITETSDLDIMIFGVLPRSEALTAVERAIDPRRNAPFDFALVAGTIKQPYLMGAPVGEQIRMIYAHTENPVIASWDSLRIMGERIRQVVPALITKVVPREIAGAISGWELNYDPKRRQDCINFRWDEDTEESQLGTPKARALKERYAEQFADFEDPAPLGFLEEHMQRLERAMIGDMIDLARSRGAEPVFLYVPGMHVPIDPDLASAFEARFDAPLWIPDEALRAELHEDRYYDNSHLNSAGRTLFSAWLSDEIAALLSEFAE